MKNLLFLLSAFSFSIPLQAQWTGTSITGETTRTGNVVIGNSTLEGSFGANDKILQLKGEGVWLSFVSTINGGGSFNLAHAAGLFTGLYSRSAPILFYTSPTPSGGLAERLRIGTDGNVGIGTASPGSFKLAVEGKVGAREFHVTTASPWPDYVFDPSYKLRPLSEVAEFIATNKHLPEIPSASEIETAGHQLGEMDALILKKVEELTLYILDQENKIKDQNEKIKELENQLKIMSEGRNTFDHKTKK
jgi:hypothetical protein